MRYTLCGQPTSELSGLLAQHGFSIATADPEVIVAVGGDGTVLQAEQEFPGVPKLLLRGSKICKLCSKLKNEEVLAKVAAGSYRVRELAKLEARVGSETLVGMNDIIVHNENARRGIRYSLTVNGVSVGDEVIGDGIVVATPLGSTGYYRSITDSFFTIGMGIAFNNSTEQADHMVVEDTSTVALTVIRGPVVVYADNDPRSIPLPEGATVTIVKSPAHARLIVPLE